MLLISPKFTYFGGIDNRVGNLTLTMKKERLLEIALAFNQASSKYDYCRSIRGELGVTGEMVEAMQISGNPHEESPNTIRQKLVKAVCKNLRERLNELATEVGVLEIGKQLPLVGGWDGRVLKSFGDTGMLVIPIVLGENPTGKSTQIDQLKNVKYIELLRSSSVAA